MPLKNLPVIGSQAPFFSAVTDINDRVACGSLGGRWVVLLFFGSLTDPAGRAAHEAVLARRQPFDDYNAAYFGVSTDPEDRSVRGLKNSLPGVRYFHDHDGAISRMFGVAGDEGERRPTVFLLDRCLRFVLAEPLERVDALLDALVQHLREEPQHEAVLMAPVLTVPRVFEPELCQALIDYHGQEARRPSGVMRQIDGLTVGVLDNNFKRRRDAPVLDEDLVQLTRTRISERLIPQITRAFNWRATRIERYMVACYTAAEGGFFSPHRDNTTPGTAHRVFAVSINLNGDYDGGELCFPEFGARLYKPPPGGATVFSCSLLHTAMPVTRGDRYVYVPFLYDEARLKIRDANQGQIRPLYDTPNEAPPVAAEETEPQTAE